MLGALRGTRGLMWTGGRAGRTGCSASPGGPRGTGTNRVRRRCAESTRPLLQRSAPGTRP